jgi:hypothetical protein
VVDTCGLAFFALARPLTWDLVAGAFTRLDAILLGPAVLLAVAVALLSRRRGALVRQRRKDS